VDYNVIDLSDFIINHHEIHEEHKAFFLCLRVLRGKNIIVSVQGILKSTTLVWIKRNESTENFDRFGGFVA
jgi:hypothetical protein